MKDVEKEMHGKVEKIAQTLNIDLCLHTILYVMGARWAQSDFSRKLYMNWH